jgi:YD repeat-containing protein
VTKVVSARGDTVYGYDDQGRLTSVVSPEGALSYEYDSQGRKTRTSSAATDIRYEYDKMDRLAVLKVIKQNGLTLAQAQVYSWTYDALGRKASLSRPGGLSTSYGYDALGRLTSLVHKKGSDILGSFTMTHRADGRIATQNEMQRLATGAVTTRALVYTYDGLNRLVRETCQATGGAASYDASYEYDLAGNRTKMVKDGETVVYSYNDAGQMVTENSSLSGTLTYTYDAKGALIASSGRGESASYRYDLEDQLIGATIARRESGKAVAIEVTYVYDHSGFKVRSSSTVSIEGQSPITEDRVFLPDADNFTGYTQVFEERLGSQLAASYVFSDELLAQGP